jgi:hypothetical protein
MRFSKSVFISARLVRCGNKLSPSKFVFSVRGYVSQGLDALAFSCRALDFDLVCSGSSAKVLVTVKPVFLQVTLTGYSLLHTNKLGFTVDR